MLMSCRLLLPISYTQWCEIANYVIQFITAIFARNRIFIFMFFSTRHLFRFQIPMLSNVRSLLQPPSLPLSWTHKHLCFTFTYRAGSDAVDIPRENNANLTFSTQITMFKHFMPKYLLNVWWREHKTVRNVKCINADKIKQEARVCVRLFCVWHSTIEHLPICFFHIGKEESKITTTKT